MSDAALADYYFVDPGLVLVPIEHLTDDGLSDAFKDLAAARAGWTPEQAALFDDGWTRYWRRSDALARRTRTWPAPRRRHVAIATQAERVRPYVQLLNTSAWLVHASDVHPATSHPELFAYVLALGDRMAASGEVATASVQAAAWWLERTDEECDAFAAAAARSTRPDAAAYVAVADALPWLRRLHHVDLAPPPASVRARAIPSTGVLVPADLEDGPPALVACWQQVASATLARHRAAWRRSDPARVAACCDWLAGETPPLLVAAEKGRIVWDPDLPDRVGAVRAVLKTADAAAVERVHRDLERVAALTRRFHAAVVDPAALPAPDPETAQSGYTYLHATRGLVAYDLHEPGMERLVGPPLPYEHAMVGARTAHEWAHLADAAGFVLRLGSAEEWAALRTELAAALDDTIARAPALVRRRTAEDLAVLADGRPVGVALGRLLVQRLPDHRANLVARALMSDVEAETYVRHNVRALGAEYGPARAWRLLVRQLVEYQYVGASLGLTRVPDPRTFFVASTGLAADLFDAGVVDEGRFDQLAAIVARLCERHAIDRARLRIT